MQLHTSTKAKRGRPASPYGAKPFNAIAPLASQIIDDIHSEMPEVDFFTREDLLHLPCLGHISTISRYRYLCHAVRYLVDQRKLVLRGTNLLLPSKAKFSVGTNSALADQFYDNILRLALRLKGRDFHVMDVVALWKTDPQLTTNSKRIAVRMALKIAVQSDSLEEIEPHLYRVAE
jgi:hypothetical protein